jgi:asparagine synthase (glutamine-hydrolysing)
MCGIVGFLNRLGTPASNELLEKMIGTLEHRGPDGKGSSVRGPVAFGHRRLAIIDPKGGFQPMVNEDGQVWVTFNGEIYNFQDLRSELRARGHIFQTNCDTEVIVHAWEEWGTECVRRFRGMFAFAIADWRRRKIFLARDHFGIKPLFYGWTDRFFAFASELRPISLLPGFDHEALDLQAIDQYLWLQYIPAPRSIFKHVKKLPPAHFLEIDMDHPGEAEPREYWKLHFRPDNSRSEKDWIHAIDEVLRDSVKAHLVSDVPFGAFLSGGVDSSLIVAHMSRLIKEPVRTFSIGFNEADFDERQWSTFAAQANGTKHTVKVVRPDAFSILPDLVRHYGEPFGDSSTIPTWHVCGLARSNVPMVLSGDGADELFGGYWSHGYWMDRFGNSPPGHPALAEWLSHIQYMPTEWRALLWKHQHACTISLMLETFEREWNRVRNSDWLHKVQQMDIRTYLPYDILTKVDIASMMHGLEVRTPFVDLAVVELASRIPAHFAMDRTADGECRRKLLLKRVAELYYPEGFVHRPKMGFALPLARWFAPNGELRSEVERRLLGNDSTLQDLFNTNGIRHILDKGEPGPIWLLVVLEEWLRQNYQNSHASTGDIESCASISPMAPTAGSPKSNGTGSHSNFIDPIPEHAFAPIARQDLAQLSKPRLLLIADVPNWIFERHCITLRRFLSDEFEFTIRYDSQLFPNQQYDEADYDLVYALEWYKVKPEEIRDPMKYVSGIRSHLVWTDYDFTELTRYLDTRFNQIHVVSKRLYDIFSPAMKNVQYVSHGVDTYFFTPVTSAGQSGKKLKLGWAGNRKSVGKKGFAEFIEPLSHLPGVELVFCGYSDRNLTLEEMRDFYNAIDVYICASDFEGNNNSLMEAASMARAIITTDNGTVPEYLRNGENALVVGRTLDAFTRAVTTLRDNPELREKLGARARERAIATWDWKYRAEDYRQLFRSALSRRYQQEQNRTAAGSSGEKRVLTGCTHF